MTNIAIVSAIDRELASLERGLVELRKRVRALVIPGSSAALVPEAEQPASPTVPVDLTARGAFHPRGFWYRGAFHRCSAQIDVYIGLLRAIGQESDDAMPRTAAALRLGGARSRVYVATDPSKLFRQKSPEWVRAHSRRVADGWYADTNLSLKLKKQLVRKILRANDLRDGIDVTLVWARTRISTAKPDSKAGAAECGMH